MEIINKYKGNILYYVILLLIVIVSFSMYSYLYYPLLNSDDALIVLMAHYFQFPKDIFYWGQSRGGALIPIISQIFIRFGGIKAITAVSISNYIILLIGFFCFSSLFKSKNTKILFAIIWFLPFQRFVDILRFYIGIEYCIISVAIYFINKIWNKDCSSLKSQITLMFIILIFIISIWVLYNAIFSIIILLFVLWFYRDKKKKHYTVLIYTLIGIIISYFSLKYIYSFNMATCNECNKINNLNDIIKAISILFNAYLSVLLFTTKEYLVSIYSWSVLLFLICLVFFLVKTSAWKIIIKDKWIMFFLLDFIAFYGIYLFSRWVLLNGMGRWYYVANYISLSIAVLLIIDRLKAVKVIKYFRFALIFIVIIGAISPIYTMYNSNPTKLTPKEKVVAEFETLGNVTIIAEWWNAYISSVSNPDKIKAIPHQNDWGYTRNIALVNQAMQRDTIYLNRDMWMNSFPDTINEFGYTLKKDGKEFILGDSHLCKYKKMLSTKDNNIK
jgi:hypothetical protein